MNDPLPPANHGAEQALLGAVLLSEQALDEVAELVTVDDFYRPSHGWVFQAALDLSGRGEPVDPVAVAAQLDRDGRLVKAGGAPYLLTLIEACPTAANVAYYAEQVAAVALRRRLLEAAQLAAQRAVSPGDPDEAIERVRADLDALADRARVVDGSDIGVLAAGAVVRYGSAQVPGLATPWHDLNAFLNGGLRPSTLTVIGARPGQGKSLMGLGLCLHVALDGLGALFVSLEMPETEVTDRAISALAGVSYSRILSRSLDDADWGRVETAVDKLAGLALRVVDKPYMTLAAIRSLARGFARTDSGLGVLVIDYLQLMQPADARVPRQEQVAGMSRGLKLLAKELQVPVVALAQVNRGAESRTDKRPSMAELRESGAIEQDADHVLLLHRDDQDETRVGEIDVLLTKNRGGGTGAITLGWAPHFQQIRSLAREAA